MDDELRPGQMRVALKLDPDGDCTFPLAQSVWISNDEHNFYLRFFQIVPPIVTDANEPPVEVRARLAAGISVPAAFVPSLVRALTEAMQKYEQVTGHSLAGSGGAV
jgi:hypothetical protein